MATSEDAVRLFRVRRTVFQMLRDRGFLVDKRDLDMSMQEFKERFTDAPSRDHLMILVEMRSDPSDKLFVFFATGEDKDKKIGVKPIRKYLERMQGESVTRSIIITPTGLGAKAKATLLEFKTFQIETFTEFELLINITEHELVPEHRLLSPQDTDALLVRYRIKKAQLPRISVNDPISRYYGLKRGQVVKITRASETAGRYVTYRLVE
eukprot:c17702_g1_i1.p1 GENE.c17702_g1_i1~~c17702_g1_i1.p1  ORF type:complete len:209 (+),score=36.18 c17702_g1_i1:35-661(+)